MASDDMEVGNHEPETDDFMVLAGGWMHLAKRSFAIFEDIMKRRETKSNLVKAENLNNILAASARYLALLEEIHQQLSDTLEQASRQPDIQENLQCELESFSYLIMLWRLCQIVFLEHMEDFQTTTSATYANRLIQFRDSIGPALHNMPFHEPSMMDLQVWQNVLRLVLIGQLEQAASVLAGLSSPVKDSAAVDYLRSLLEDSPLFTCEATPHDISVWRLAIADILTEDVVLQDAEVSRILRLLLGTYEEWASVGHEFSSWLSFYISRFPYTGPLLSPGVSAADHHQFSEAYGACQDNVFPPEIDVALECILRLDWDGMFEILRKFFHNTWFSVHMWDLFHYSNCLISVQRIDEEFSRRFRETLITEYVENSIRGGHWLPFVRYVKFCSQEGQKRLNDILNTYDFRSETEREEVISTLEADGMIAALQEIYRRDAYTFLRQTNFESALQAAEKTDPEFRMLIGSEFLLHIRRSRGELKFLNEDKPTLSLLPEVVLERLGLPGLATLYNISMDSENYPKALSYLLVLLKRTFTRRDVYELISKILYCINEMRLSGTDIQANMYQQIRQWLMIVPLTNLKPATESEKSAVVELHSQVCLSVAWSVDGFCSSTPDLISKNECTNSENGFS